MKFNRLTHIKDSKSDINGKGAAIKRALWLCDCGQVKDIIYSRVKLGRTKSCGCLRVELSNKANIKHGFTKIPEYSVWLGVKERCLNKTADSYPSYGGRGITICDRWLNSFKDFLLDVGNRPTKNHVIGRIDNNKGYSPDNCQWVTRKQNSRNTRTSKRWVVNEICYMAAIEAAEFNGVSITTIQKWCKGVCVNRRWYPKKTNCYAYKVYQ